MPIIKATVVRMNRNTGLALIWALILTLHGVVLCAVGVPERIESSGGTLTHQEQGCHEHPQHDSGKSSCCICCESVVCAPRTELTRSEGQSASVRMAVFMPLQIATLPLNPHSDGGRLRRIAADPPPDPPVSLFLTHQTLLI